MIPIFIKNCMKEVYAKKNFRHLKNNKIVKMILIIILVVIYNKVLLMKNLQNMLTTLEILSSKNTLF